MFALARSIPDRNISLLYSSPYILNEKTSWIFIVHSTRDKVFVLHHIKFDGFNRISYFSVISSTPYIVYPHHPISHPAAQNCAEIATFCDTFPYDNANALTDIGGTFEGFSMGSPIVFGALIMA